MKYILVTGAFGGMGKATLKALKKSGYIVIALDKTINREMGDVISIPTDLTDYESVMNAYRKVREITDNLYAIVHFAGIYMLDSLVEIDKDHFINAFNLNFFGAFYINRTFFPLLKEGSKIIITTSELAPLDPLPFTGIYAITKGTLDKYAYSLRMELQLKGISVSVLRAGAVDTSMLSVSTRALDDFCDRTKVYTCNAKRFKKIVDSVEAKKVSPDKIALKITKILNIKKPKFAYSINRNFWLLLLNAMPESFQFWVIKKVLK